MASKGTFHLSSCIFLLFLFMFATIQAKRDIPKPKISSPFEFLKQLKGCHKGNKTEGIHLLKNYLQEFGYLNLNHTNSKDDDFDDTVESALKTYQHNYHIKPTGTLDDETVSKMITPRCGVADIINGTNYMQTSNNKHDSGSNTIHTVAHFSFFPGNLRWPASQTHLTYAFSSNTPSGAMGPVASAFQKWASATHFAFSQVQQNADLVIGFHRGNHGDGAPFDGPGGTLAHAFAPTDGRFHYDGDETWSVGPVSNAFDLETIAIHEIGHLLGLGHSSVPEAIMFPSIPSGATKNLHADDIQGIRALYNV
ncbi:hypothetical protein RD792_004241 [Penstemon davidsonii]|uniref:Peptidase metallopeptidase domain-containing protein n=1 Tax=Penstemon davidsonii TaxID=160366 RepID=A0ABR0DH18_9LAMI|nr:hypothetical protein RD792_004241 [Penstemon davidsonii]